MSYLFSRVDPRTKTEFQQACQITRISENEKLAELARKFSRKLINTQTSVVSKSKKANFLQYRGYKE